MAVTSLASQSYIEPTPTPPVKLLAQASDGDPQSLFKLTQDGNPDFVLTARSSAAEAVNLTVPFASLLKLYTAQITNVTVMVIKARCFVYSDVNVAANGYYWEVVATFSDVAGAMTLSGASYTIAVNEGTASTDPLLTNSGSNTLQIAINTTGATAKSVRCELNVQHIQ